MRENYRTVSAAVLVGHGFWALLWMLCYRVLLFRSIDGMGEIQCLRILWALVVGCSAWGIWWRRERRTSFGGVQGDLAIAFGLYTVLSYRQMHPVLIYLFLIGTALLIMVCIFLIQSQPVRADTYARHCRIREFRHRQSLSAVHRTLAMGLGGMMLACLVPTLFSGPLAAGAPEDTQAVQQQVEDCMPTLVQLEEDTWQTLTLQQKLDVLQTVIDLEQSSLGLPYALTARVAQVEGDVIASYNDRSLTITISADDLETRSGGYMLEAICHEAYHAYQYRLLDLYTAAPEQSRSLQVFRSVEQYEKEFRDYESGEEDFEAYYTQACESDARDYAEERVQWYVMKLHMYMTQESAA